MHLVDRTCKDAYADVFLCLNSPLTKPNVRSNAYMLFVCHKSESAKDWSDHKAESITMANDSVFLSIKPNKLSFLQNSLQYKHRVCNDDSFVYFYYFICYDMHFSSCNR